MNWDTVLLRTRFMFMIYACMLHLFIDHDDDTVQVATSADSVHGRVVKEILT